MNHVYEAFAVPGFLLFMAIEFIYARRKKKKEIFKFSSSITNISIGVADRLMDLFFSGSFYALYYYVYKNFHFFDIGKSWYVWVILILATDLVWYWYHRLGHEVNVLWGAHIVHHQSEEFNYTVSARITIFQAFVRTVFWSFLPLVGFHPDMVIPILLFHGAYSFFTHTQMIGKLGFLENILITPSHHRVHHASDEKYLNKNYGDVFVFWDMLFGTFQREQEAPTYGITHPLKSNSFLWQHFHYVLEIAVAVNRAATFKDKFLAVFGPPENMDPRIRPALERKYKIHTEKAQTNANFRFYLNFQLAVSIISLFVMSVMYDQMETASIVAISSTILVTLINCGALLEQKRWIYYLEIIRFFIPIIYVSQQYAGPEFLITMTVTFIIVSMLFPLQEWYHKRLFEERPELA
ncbi:sterol desaturase [Pedobacter sp. HMF7056]|uniref:Sterol desaturase n=1 Tax=Hufsiella ginkgonis TaxID=2695274 RepID=A0A7K1XYA8_9SPHI|nr:sterol desaturase [Hufsiella ginkgonis]